MTPRGTLIVLSGPSGSGKSTLISRTLADGDLRVRLAISATTRKPRPGEKDGVHYYFWSPEQFAESVAKGEFLEWAEVHGKRYGTLHNEVERYLAQGMHVLLEIDVQGARQIRKLHPQAVLMFLRTSSLDEYEKRLRGRKTEDEAAIQRRLTGAREELAAVGEYDYQLMNDDLETAVRDFKNILIHLGGKSRAG